MSVVDSYDRRDLGRLPPELLHIIFDPLDKATLSACSLVARSWLQIARPYLFKTILYHKRPATRIGFGLDSDPPRPLQDLLEFLDTTPSIRNYIRVLSLKSIISSHDFIPVIRQTAVGGHLDTLYAIIQHTQSLRILSVHDFRFAQPTTLTLDDMHRKPALEYLDCLVVDPPWHDFGINEALTPQLLFMVGAVGTLRLNTGHVPPSFLRPSSSYDGALAQVRSLNVNTMEAPGVLPMIDYDRLESFHIDYNLPRDCHLLLAEFLRSAAQGLQDLAFPLPGAYPRDTEGHMNILDLSVLQRLRSLSMNLRIYTPTTCPTDNTGSLGLYSPTYAFIVRTLSTQSDTLRSLTLQLVYDGNEPMADISLEEARDANILQMDWSELDGALATRAIRRGLEAIRVTFEGFPDEGTARQCVKLALPRAHRIGVLRLASTGSPNA